jgi:hypothetical protein
VGVELLGRSLVLARERDGLTNPIGSHSWTDCWATTDLDELAGFGDGHDGLVVGADQEVERRGKSSKVGGETARLGAKSWNDSQAQEDPSQLP